MQDKTVLIGRVVVEASDGQRVEGTNMLVNGGRDLFADIIGGDSSTVPTHIAMGTGTTAITVTDTTLENEQDRNAISLSTASSGVVSYKCFFSKSEMNGVTLANAGIFTAAAAGTMTNAVVLDSTIAKTSSISITLTWTITLANA